ncbi:hypothetical protein D3C72_1463360 [compost metagenome]
MALVVEAEAVDHRFVFHQAEDARFVVARLRARRHRADFGKAETDLQERFRHFGILVVSGRHAERIGEGKACDGLGEPLVLPCRTARHEAGLQCLDRQAVGGLRIEEEKAAAGKIGEGVAHASSSGKTWRPSSASGSGFSHRTADRNSGA